MIIYKYMSRRVCSLQSSTCGSLLSAWVTHFIRRLNLILQEDADAVYARSLFPFLTQRNVSQVDPCPQACKEPQSTLLYCNFMWIPLYDGKDASASELEHPLSVPALLSGPIGALQMSSTHPVEPYSFCIQ